MRLVNQSTCYRSDDGTDEISINGIRVTQKPYGVVKYEHGQVELKFENINLIFLKDSSTRQ